MKLRRWLSVCLAVVFLCVCCSGCSVISADVEKQLVPPKNNAEQEAVQTALRQYLRSDNYSLKYPGGGSYQTAFILLDQVQLSGDNSSLDEPVVPNSFSWKDLAVVFYRWNGNYTMSHVHLLQKNKEGKWITLADVEGYSEDVEEVQFADVNGDGFPELLVGWKLYNSNDKRLSVYRLDSKLKQPLAYASYTKLLVGEMTGDAAQDLILLNIADNRNEVTARLFSQHEEDVVFRGEARLDDHILRFGEPSFSALSPTVTGLYLDCYKDANTTITELIYWDGTDLRAPFYDDKTGLNVITARETGFASRDIDGDGIVEWPVSERLPGYEHTAVNKTFWRTDWMAYDFRSGTTERKFSSVVNSIDAYVIRLREEWIKEIGTVYDSQKHILQFWRTGDNAGFLEILTTAAENASSIPEDFTLFEQTDKYCYAYKLNGNVITPEEVRYLFSVI